MAKIEVCEVKGINCELNLFSIIAYFETKVQRDFSEWTATRCPAGGYYQSQHIYAFL